MNHHYHTEVKISGQRSQIEAPEPSVTVMGRTIDINKIDAKGESKQGGTDGCYTFNKSTGIE